MRNILNIIIIFLVATVNANAQVATSRYASYGQVDAIVNQPSVTTTPRYSSPIYEPFSSSVPSDQTEVGAEQGGAHKGHIRRFGNFDDVPEGGEQEQSSPIGDSVLPLMAMALLAFGAIAIRRRKHRI
jgi:hypothetical protein